MLKEEIDQFQLEEEKEEQGAPVIHVLDAEDKFNRFSGVHTSSLVVARVVDSSEEEEEEMALNSRKGLRDLMVGRNKGSSSKEVPKSQVPANLPPPLPPPTTALGLLPIPNLKKKRKEQEQKTAKDKRAFFVDNKEEPSGAKVCQQQHAWAPRLELDGTTIPWNSSIREF